MKHAGPGASIKPGREQTRAGQRRRTVKRTTRSPAPPGRDWIGPWRLDVTDEGDLVAINEDSGVTRLLARADNNVEEGRTDA